jgi:hypothetical protein
MMKLIPSSVRKWEDSIPIPNTCQLRRQISQPMGHQMHKLSFPLNAAVNAYHASAEYSVAIFIEE